MNPELVIGIAKETIEVTLYISLPILGVGLVVGLLVSLFQAVTQFHKMTLTFVPKIVAVLLSLFFLLPWLIHKMVFFTEHLITQLPQYVR